MLPYRTILEIGCIVLTARYAFDSSASTRGRVVVSVLTLASLILPTTRGLAWDISDILIQLAICLFVLLRLTTKKSS